SPPYSSGTLSFSSCSVRLSDLNSFPTRRSSDLRTEKIEVAASDRSFNVLLSVSDGNLILQDARSVLAILEPLKHRQYAASILEKDRKSTRLNSSHVSSSYAVFCLKKNNATESPH